MTGKEPPHHTGAGANASHTQPGANLFQRQIRFDGNQLKQPIFVGIKRREFAAHRLRCHRPGLSKARDPSDRRTHADLKRRRRFMAGRPCLDRTHNPLTQVP